MYLLLSIQLWVGEREYSCLILFNFGCSQKVCLTLLDQRCKVWIVYGDGENFSGSIFFIQNAYHTFWMLRKVWIEGNLLKIAPSEVRLTPSINECSSHLVVEDPDDWDPLWIGAGEIRLLYPKCFVIQTTNTASRGDLLDYTSGRAVDLSRTLLAF